MSRLIPSDCCIAFVMAKLFWLLCHIQTEANKATDAKA